MVRALRLIPVVLVVFILVIGAGAAMAQADPPILEAIQLAAKDFALGNIAGDRDKVVKTTESGVQIVALGKLPNGRDLLSFTTYSQLVETAASRGGGKLIGEDLSVEVVDVKKNVASVVIEDSDALVYAHLARINGKWKVANALRTAQPAGKGGDTPSIEKAGLDYVDGYYSGSPEREILGLHPSLHKVVVRQASNGREFLFRIDRQTLEEAARAGLGNKPEAERKISVEILHASDTSAAIAIGSADFHDLAHVVKINGEWKIVNVLWVPNR